MPSSIQLQQKLEAFSGRKIQLKINDNLFTMLSVKWDPECTKISLHRMFLTAPQDITQALGHYIKQGKHTVSPTIKIFIDKNLKKLDHSHLVDPHKLCMHGCYYNLQKVYNDLNKEYFNSQLPLYITWYGKPNKRNRTKVTFGLYHDSRRLIKIHRLLDHPSIPNYVVEYVVYHEMLHFVHPSYHDGKKQRIHDKKFKEQEMRFRYYDLAQKWIKDHQHHFFKGSY